MTRRTTRRVDVVVIDSLWTGISWIARVFAWIGGAMIMIAATIWWGMRQSPVVERTTRVFDGREARAALWEAKWELLTPFVALVALFSGVATAVESAAITALYVLIVETLLHRDRRPLDEAMRAVRSAGCDSSTAELEQIAARLPIASASIMNSRTRNARPERQPWPYPNNSEPPKTSSRQVISAPTASPIPRPLRRIVRHLRD